MMIVINEIFAKGVRATILDIKNETTNEVNAVVKRAICSKCRLLYKCINRDFMPIHIRIDATTNWNHEYNTACISFELPGLPNNVTLIVSLEESYALMRFDKRYKDEAVVWARNSICRFCKLRDTCDKSKLQPISYSDSALDEYRCDSYVTDPIKL